jgi:prepilin peptidase CpaA
MLDLSTTQQFIARTSEAGGHAVLAALLCTAAVIDLRTYRIPNRLTAGGALIGILWSLLPGGLGVLDALGGAALGLVALLPLYVLRVMGAGDVKLMAMAGAFLGAPQVLMAALLSFIAGGVFAIGFAVWRRATGQMLANVRDAVFMNAIAVAAGQRLDFASTPSIGKFPYGIAICLGTLASLAVLHLG